MSTASPTRTGELDYFFAPEPPQCGQCMLLHPGMLQMPSRSPLIRVRLGAGRRLVFHSSQGTRKTQLVTIRVGEVEEPLAPFRIARCRVRTVAFRDHLGVEGVHIGMVEDHTPPPGPTSIGGLGDKIKKAGSRPRFGKPPPSMLPVPMPSSRRSEPRPVLLCSPA